MFVSVWPQLADLGVSDPGAGRQHAAQCTTADVWPRESAVWRELITRQSVICQIIINLYFTYRQIAVHLFIRSLRKDFNPEKSWELFCCSS